MANRYAGDPATDRRNPARAWFLVQGFLLLGTAILGLVPGAVDLFHGLRMHIEAGEDAVHWLLGVAALVIGAVVRNARLAGTLAVVFGIVYLGTGVLGFFVSDLGPWHVGLGDNLLHLALGIVTLSVGLATQRRESGRTALRTTA